MTIGTLLLPRRIDLAPATPTQWLADIRRLGLAVLLISAAYCAGGIVALLLATILAALVEERRRTRASLRSVQADLAHAARVTAMGELTAAIAHEVNQPLTAIAANAQACLRRIAAGSLEPRELREVLHDIVDDGRRANEVIQRIRGLMRKSPIHFAPLNVTAVVDDVIALVRAELARHQISLRTNLADDLPLVRGDRIQLQQVVLNLVMNAIEAMADTDTGSRALTIHSRRDGAGCVVVGVRDSGPGLDPKDLEIIFDRFYTTKPSGMGMGLSVSRSIVDAHGGRLWAVSLESRGAMFQLSLPTVA
jgi:C4-dicarboxylate-specific signal transduction histidine kinase